MCFYVFFKLTLMGLWAQRIPSRIPIPSRSLNMQHGSCLTVYAALWW